MNAQIETYKPFGPSNANVELSENASQRTCDDCRGLLGEHDAAYCSKCWDKRLIAIYEAKRRKAVKYEVTPPGSPWIEGVDLDAIHPQDCYLQAYRYASDLSRFFEDHQLVHGETSLAFGGHAWVELPNGLVFDGVYQRFYRTEDYYGEMAHAKPWYFYEPDAAIMLNAHLEASVGVWWIKLGLPMILDRPPMRIGSEDAWELLVNHYKQFDESRLEKEPLNIIRAVATGCGIKGTGRMKKHNLVQAILQNQETGCLNACEGGEA